MVSPRYWKGLALVMLFLFTCYIWYNIIYGFFSVKLGIFTLVCFIVNILLSKQEKPIKLPYIKVEQKEIGFKPPPKQKVISQTSRKIIAAINELEYPLTFRNESDYERFFVIDLQFNSLVAFNNANIDKIIKNLSAAIEQNDKLFFEIKGTKLSLSGLKNIPKKAIDIKQYPIPKKEYNKDLLRVIIGLDITDKPFFANVAEFPHAIIAGTTGSGKTWFVTSIIYQLMIYNVDLLLIDPKQGQAFSVFEQAKNYPAKIEIIKEMSYGAANNVTQRLDALIEEMQDRYSKGNFENFNPIVLVVDELADLLSMDKTIEEKLIILARKARQAKIFMLLATQKPDSETLSSQLRGNMDTRIGLRVPKQTDSKVIIDEFGCEKLSGKGDLLFKSQETPQPIRLQALSFIP